MLDEEEGQGGRRDEEEGGTRRKDRHGGRSNVEEGAMRRVKKNEKNVKKKNKDEKVPQGRIVNPAVLLILGSQSVLGLSVNYSLVGPWIG